MSQAEQADGHSKHGSAYHRHLKRKKVRLERKAARDALRRGDEPIKDHGYKGWET